MTAEEPTGGDGRVVTARDDNDAAFNATGGDNLYAAVGASDDSICSGHDGSNVDDDSPATGTLAATVTTRRQQRRYRR